MCYIEYGPVAIADAPEARAMRLRRLISRPLQIIKG